MSVSEVILLCYQQEFMREKVWEEMRDVWVKKGSVSFTLSKRSDYLWLTEGSGGLICHHWWVDRGCEGQSLSDLEASVCSDSDGQNEMRARWSSLHPPNQQSQVWAQTWPWVQQGHCCSNPEEKGKKKKERNSPTRPLHPGAAVSHQVLPLSIPKPPKLPPPAFVPFFSNRAVWDNSPAFNLPSRSRAEANKAPG